MGLTPNWAWSACLIDLDLSHACVCVSLGGGLKGQCAMSALGAGRVCSPRRSLPTARGSSVSMASRATEVRMVLPHARAARASAVVGQHVSVTWGDYVGQMEQ